MFFIYKDLTQVRILQCNTTKHTEKSVSQTVNTVYNIKISFPVSKRKVLQNSV